MAEIAAGLLLLVAVAVGDSPREAAYLAEKCLDLRVFDDHSGKMNLSARDLNKQVLAVSQFTLYGDCRRGRRPSFTDAAPPDVAEPLYQEFVSELKKSGLKVESGRFAERMLVEIWNDGPVTLILDSKPSAVSGQRSACR